MAYTQGEGLVDVASNTFKLSMIGHQDDIAKWRLADLQPYWPYPQLGFAARLPWSKNVNDKRDSPLQVKFCSMDTRYCTVSNVSLWLEYHFLLDPEYNEFLFGYGGLSDPICIKETLGPLFSAATNRDEMDGIG